MGTSKDTAEEPHVTEPHQAEPKPPLKLLIWRTFGTALSVTFKHPGKLLLLGAISQAAMIAMFILFGWPLLLDVTNPVALFQDGQLNVNMNATPEISLPGSVSHLLSQFLTLISFAFAYSSISAAVHEAMEGGGQIDLRLSLQAGLRAVIPASLSLAILYLLYLMLSLVVFAVSYGLSVDISDKVLLNQLVSALATVSALILVYTGIVMVAGIPAISIERIGALSGLSRSMAITKGHRLRIFGILMVSYFTYFFLLAVFQVAALSLMRQMAAVETSLGQTVYWVLFPLFVVMASTFFLVLATMIYQNLVAVKEGSQQVEAVFD